jgi:hypothetical protein
MVQIIFRAFSTVVTVVIAVVVSATLDNSSFGKVLAAILIAAVIAAVEWLLIWTPKHYAVARKLLDRRTNMIGFWLQNVDRIIRGQEGNQFSIFWVDYQDSRGYFLNGFAYNPSGIEHARWWSVGSPEFTDDGRSMSYRWAGTVMENESNDDDPDRTGVASIKLDGETGRVEHVGMNITLIVSLQRITPGWLNHYGLGQYQPSDLKTKKIRDGVALSYARSLLPRAAPGIAAEGQ